MRVLVRYCVRCVEITEASSLGLCVVRCGCRVVAHDRDCGGTVNFKPCGAYCSCVCTKYETISYAH